MTESESVALPLGDAASIGFSMDITGFTVTMPYGTYNSIAGEIGFVKIFLFFSFKILCK